MISVVIPYFNAEEYIREAIESAYRCVEIDRREIIVVDDGSNDPRSVEALRELDEEGVTVIRKNNGGPASARNEGVAHANGDIIVFLDSDNKIRHQMVARSLEVFSENEEVGVVYGNPEFFGQDTKNRFSAKPFNRYELLLNNYIDMCSAIRKKVWEEVGGLDEDCRLVGFEDWEFWLRVSETRWEFRYFEETWYEYRLRKDSLVTDALSENRYREMLCYIYWKHHMMYRRDIRELIRIKQGYERDRSRPLRSLFKYLRDKYLVST